MAPQPSWKTLSRGEPKNNARRGNFAKSERVTGAFVEALVEGLNARFKQQFWAQGFTAGVSVPVCETRRAAAKTARKSKDRQFQPSLAFLDEYTSPVPGVCRSTWLGRGGKQQPGPACRRPDSTTHEPQCNPAEGEV
jgi:hypothetical protein